MNLNHFPHLQHTETMLFLWGFVSRNLSCTVLHGLEGGTQKGYLTACAAEAATQTPTIAGFVVVDALCPFDGIACSDGERFFCRDVSSHLLLRIFGFTGVGVVVEWRA
jgi:hypothetical protein